MLDGHEFLKKDVKDQIIYGFLDFPCDPWDSDARVMPTMVLFFFEADAYMNFFI